MPHCHCKHGCCNNNQVAKEPEKPIENVLDIKTLEPESFLAIKPAAPLGQTLGWSITPVPYLKRIADLFIPYTKSRDTNNTVPSLRPTKEGQNEISNEENNTNLQCRLC